MRGTESLTEHSDVKFQMENMGEKEGREPPGIVTVFPSRLLAE